jgi:molybdopterin converting factor small subunit
LITIIRGKHLPEITINFIGPWRVFLGMQSVTVNANNIDEAKDYVETTSGPVFWEKIKAMGVGKKQSIWDNSNILLNGKNIKTLQTVTFNDGDRLDLLPKVAGG